MEDAYIVYFKRVPFSRARPNDPERDMYNDLRMDDLLSRLIRKSVDDTGINPEEIGDVITGCAFQAGENWTYGGRHPVLLSELPVSVPAMSLDRACSSSLNAVSIGAMEIMSEKSDIVIAGGMEHMTHVPLGISNPYIKPNMSLMLNPRYSKYDMNVSYNMGLTAEKLAALRGITRKEMDEYSYNSHLRARKAYESGFMKDEIMPVTVERDGEEIKIEKDLSIRDDASLESMEALKPAFKPDGIITAGNSAPLNDGASMVMLMSERAMNEYGLKPMARIVDFAAAGVDPTIMGDGPVPATRKILSRNKIDPQDIDLWEINEAFAVVVLNAVKSFNLDLKKVNINGGGISIGHPLGATGARIAGTLARQLANKRKRYGIATLCVGGGQGYSLLMERI
ncbi:acetyl-CoA C-acetyltransferase [Picrophilus oshimae]|uniref:3-ketoacyl-CoA thiolase n=1 Tax=Picrophilus torridus (strain ATCC 700027 / DSM 9790 / JCM 10055 / NBRC 100828 / KAW 2/3) TaxID=1122961 RepID=Q6L094_PICTO|nr:acetyl-CoA C-acetyltransferase [Picrophilus oshimae]AAT43608.1 3-ketoacyl-CoA thiolase [Picrophilus oshimae DSM 9789]SMD31235.1 acetyl-CoA C-acetyltransferase [Picrophilus oshimae DSM 9789]